MDAVSGSGYHATFEIQSDQPTLRTVLPLFQRFPSDEGFVRALQRNGEPMPLQRICLVVEFLTGEHQPASIRSMSRASSPKGTGRTLRRRPDGVENGVSVLGMTEDFIAEFPGIAVLDTTTERPRITDPSHREAKPAKFPPRTS